MGEIVSFLILSFGTGTGIYVVWLELPLRPSIFSASSCLPVAACLNAGAVLAL